MKIFFSLEQQQVGDLKHASSEESPLTDDDSSADTYAGDNADNEDGFDDNSDHPVIHNEALLKNGDEQPAPMPMEAPVKSAQQPVQLPQEPQMPVKAPMAPKTWRKPMPMAPTKGQYPMDTKSAQVPQQDEVPYFRRPAVTLLRTPWGFEHSGKQIIFSPTIVIIIFSTYLYHLSEGLAVVVDGPQYMQGLPQAPVYAPQYHDQQQQQYHDQTQQNHN